MGRILTLAEVKRFYDRCGRLQDTQVFYEGRAVRTLVDQGRFGQARAVFEFGCGTGALARRLLRDRLPPEARYTGVDLSETMVRIATRRLLGWRERAEVRLTTGAIPVADPDASFDRFLCCYVLDLMGEEMIAAVIAEARRLLEPGGLLCVASLTGAQTRLGRLIERLWNAAHERNPALTGGCRPIRVAGFLRKGWRIDFRRLVTQSGLTSEVVLASRL